MATDVAASLAHAYVNTFNDRSSFQDFFTEHATLWNNLAEDVEKPHAEWITGVELLQGAVPDIRYVDLSVVSTWDDGFVIQYMLLATLPDGSQVRAPACQIGTVRGDRVSRMQEYIDGSQVAPLGEILNEELQKAP